MEVFESGGRPVKKAVMRCCVVTDLLAGTCVIMFGAGGILGAGGICSGIRAVVICGVLGGRVFVPSVGCAIRPGFRRVWFGVGRRAEVWAGIVSAVVGWVTVEVAVPHVVRC